MGCGGCGSSGVLPGSLSVRNRVKGRRVRGYSGGGILKAKKLLVEEAKEVKASSEELKVNSTPEELNQNSSDTK